MSQGLPTPWISYDFIRICFQAKEKYRSRTFPTLLLCLPSDWDFLEVRRCILGISVSPRMCLTWLHPWKRRTSAKAKAKRTARGRCAQQVSPLQLPRHLLQFPHNHSANIHRTAPQWTMNSVTDGQYSLLWYFLGGPQCHFWSFFQFTILSPAKAEPACSHPLILAHTSPWVNSFFFLEVIAKNFPCFFLPARLLSLPEPFFLSLGRFQQYHQLSKGSWIKELSA